MKKFQFPIFLAAVSALVMGGCKTTTTTSDVVDFESINANDVSDVVGLQDGIVYFKRCTKKAMLDQLTIPDTFPKDENGSPVATLTHCNETVPGYDNYDAMPVATYSAIFDELNIKIEDIKKHGQLKAAVAKAETELAKAREAVVEKKAAVTAAVDAKQAASGSDAATSDLAKATKAWEAAKRDVSIAENKLEVALDRFKANKSKIEQRQTIIENLSSERAMQTSANSDLGTALLSPFAYIRSKGMTSAILLAPPSEVEVLADQMTHYQATKACQAKGMQLASATEMGAYILQNHGHQGIYKFFHIRPENGLDEITDPYGKSGFAGDDKSVFYVLKDSDKSRLGRFQTVHGQTFKTIGSDLAAGRQIEALAACVNSDVDYAAELAARNFRFCKAKSEHYTQYVNQSNRTLTYEPMIFDLKGKYTDAELKSAARNEALAKKFDGYSNIGAVSYKLVPNSIQCGWLLGEQ